MSKLNFETFRNQLGEWDKYLQPIFEDERMYNLFQEFKTCREKITPKSENLFRFFKECSPENLKLLIIGMDSYPGLYRNGEYQATGLAFDCRNSPDGKCQPSLISFWDGLFGEYNEEPIYENNLSFLSNQGVLLTNRSLNCKVNKTGSFMGKWDFFWEYFFSDILINFPGVPVLLLGKDAEKLRPYIFELGTPVFVLTHPSHAARTQSPWPTKGYFKNINSILEGNNGAEYKIEWNPRKYKQSLKDKQVSELTDEEAGFLCPITEVPF